MTAVQPQTDLVTLTIDGFEISVPKGTLVIRAAEQLGIQIPRFCDHPLLSPVGACRQCLVDIEINGRAFPKPQASCTIPVENGMVVKTQLTSEVAHKAQEGVMEFLLVNHPLDCPVCDKGGECPLQNQAMTNGRGESRFEGKKRTFEKPLNISSQVLLDRERCILCARCTRFSKEIAGDPFIDMGERGALQQVAIYEKDPFDSYFSGNTVQICPVGALTGAAYRFRSRPFDLVSTPSVCEHCASGCSMRTDVRRNKTLRRLAGNDPEVNEEWNCDKGRWAFQYTMAKDRIASPLIRENGVLREASWPEALAAAAQGLQGKKSGVLVGGRTTVEDAYAYAKFARVVLGTNDIDFRSRPHSEEERDFLAAHVVGSKVRYSDIDTADHVVLVGFEPEEESPIVFLRIHKQVRRRALQVTAIAPWHTRGFKKLQAKYIGVTPGAEANALVQLTLTNQSVIVVGERLCESAGALSAVAELANKSGAKIAWVPRRAGERGALEAGAVGNLLPGGRPITDAAARVDVAAAWSVDSDLIPTSVGADSQSILASAASGEIKALVVGGVDPFDMHVPDFAGFDNAFVLSLELRPSAITERADVVLPVAAVTEKSGSFMSWEGRTRSFEQAVPETPHHSDLYILSLIAEALGKPLGFSTVRGAAKEFGTLANWDGARSSFTPRTQSSVAEGVTLASWRQLLDNGSLQVNEPNLAGTARKAVARINEKLAAALGVGNGDLVTVSTNHGALSLNVEISEMCDQVVWLPRNAVASQSLRMLGALNGAQVNIRKGALIDVSNVRDLILDDPGWLIAIKGLLVFVFCVLCTLMAIWFERRIVARMQLRLGPNRVGKFGLLQSLADGVKLALKEDLIPAAADKLVFIIAPIISATTCFMAFAVIPMSGPVKMFGQETAFQLTDIPVGVLYILSVASVGVYGIVLAGWSSGSTYPLLGGLRSSAQVISYEIAMGLSLVAVFLYAGSMSTIDIVDAQDQFWYAVVLFPSFIIYAISMVGETNRAPFDLAEAEGELVGGFHTEYSSLKFALFFLAEYVNIVGVSALATTLFLGGYHAPPGLGFTESWLGGWFTFIWFFIKVVLFFFVFVWLRGTLPRLRYDQFMQFGWKVLIPANVAWIMVVAVLRYFSLNGASRTSILIFGGAVMVIFLVGSSLYERSKEKKSEVNSSAVDAPAPFPVPELPMKISTFTVPRAESERE